jgi:hypothetical protein
MEAQGGKGGSSSNREGNASYRMEEEEVPSGGKGTDSSNNVDCRVFALVPQIQFCVIVGGR